MSGLPRVPERGRSADNIAVVGVTHNRVAATPCMNGDTWGWYLEIGHAGAWISDQDADRLARAMLFEGDKE